MPEKFRLCMALALCTTSLCVPLSGCRSHRRPSGGDTSGYTIPDHTLPYSGIRTTPKTDWQAQWIWDESDGTEENVWMSFRKKVDIAAVPQTLEAHIAVDSRYWLYINGSLAVFEGGLKRGPTQQDGYYDTVDLAPYLRKGENTIAVLVWYWGKDTSYSNVDSGRGGLLFEAASGALRIVSDRSWKVARNTAYGTDPGAQQPNYRLPESNIYYDARSELGDWTAEKFDDSAWASASELGKGGCAPWNTLYPRPIPLFKDYGLREYENSASYKGYTVSGTEELVLTIPYNAQCTPYLQVEAPAGREIVMQTENARQGSVISTYITKDGVQEFEALGWFNGEQVTYRVPAGVRILSLQYRETGYQTEFSGIFTSNDEFLNTLWQKSLRTLYVTMRDNFMDCPDRERAQWWGDVTNEMAMTMYCMDSNAYLLYQKGVFSMLSWRDANSSVLETVVPISNDYFELPMQQLAGVCGFLTYYLYTGDTAFLESVYDAAKNYVLLWNFGADGLVVHRGGSWDWMDWGENADVAALENAWYYRALSCMVRLAEAAGREADIAEYRMRMDTLYPAYQRLWTDAGYKSDAVRRPDDRANAVAVLAGLVDLTDPARVAGVRTVLTQTMNASPYMERYVLDALCEMGLMEDAQTRIRTRYAAMVREDYSTLWEFWDKNSGTMNHAWSGGPLLTMSQYMAGIEPTAAGYTSYRVRPQMGTLTEISCTVPSVKGYIRTEMKRENGVFTLKLESPAGAEATVAVPRPAGQNPQVYYQGALVFAGGRYVGDRDGVRYAGSDNAYIYFTLDGKNDQTAEFRAENGPESDSGERKVTLVQPEHGTVAVNGSTEAVQTFAAGTEITVTVQPEDGYVFTGFGGSIGGTASEMTVALHADLYIEANLASRGNVYRTVQIYMPADSDMAILYNGTVRTRGSKDAVTLYAAEGAEVVLQARDGILHTFRAWSGDIASDEAEIRFTVHGDMTLALSANVQYGEDLALGAQVSCTASMESGNTWSRNNLTDGSLATGFTTEVQEGVGGIFRQPVTITIDLGAVRTFSLLSLAPRTNATDADGRTPNFPLEFTVRVSRDGASYTEVAHCSDIANPEGQVQSYTFEPQSARYIRIQVLSVSSCANDEGVPNPYRVQLTEIMVRDRI